MKYTPKEIPEGINVAKEHPLQEILILIAALMAFVVLLYFALGLISDRMLSQMSYQKEAELFSNFNPIKQKSSFLQTDDKKSQQYRDILVKLWAPYKDEAGVDLKFNIVNHPLPNAFASVGGQIGVTTELMKIMESENELAFVLCHEIGHFYLRHPLKRMGRTIAVLGLLTLIGVSDASSAAPIEMGLNLTALKYSRDQETEADLFALDCMHKSYGHVEKYDGFFRKVEDDKYKSLVKQDKISAYFSSHPLSEDRMEHLKHSAVQKGIALTGPLTPL